MKTNLLQFFRGTLLCAVSLGFSTAVSAAEDVDDALKGRDLNTIMKLLQAEGDDAQSPAPAIEPVVVPEPVLPAVVTPVAPVGANEPAPVAPEPVVAPPPAVKPPAPEAIVLPDPQQLSSKELDEFRAKLAKEMEEAKATQQAQADFITKQVDAASVRGPRVHATPEPAIPEPTLPEAAPLPEPAPATVVGNAAPVTTIDEPVKEEKKRGLFSRIFGSDKDASTKQAKAVKPADSSVGSLKVSAEEAPKRPDPVSNARPGLSADAMKKNREALEGLLTSSREDVVKMALGQASGQTESSAVVAEGVDPDAWKKAGPNAWRYNGEWQGGSMHGQGRLVYADGWEYVGSWKNGSMDGQGTLVMPDGTKYEGQWVTGRMHGFGQLTYPDGWQFVGQWQQGRISGQGTLIHPGQ